MLLGSTELALIMVSVVRAKYLAVNIGPEGYGEYAMLNSFFTILTALCGGWIARGTIKYIAEYRHKEDEESVSKVHNYSISLALMLCASATVLVLLFHEFVRQHFLSPEILLVHFSIFAASFPATCLMAFFGWLLQGYMKVKETAVLKIYVALINLVTILLFVYLFQLTGYFLSILVSAVAGVFIYWRATRSLVKTKWMWPDYRQDIMKKILRFGSVNFGLLVVNNVAEYIQRILILASLSLSAVGLFQVATSIMGYMGIANRGSLFINDPKMSQDLSTSERNEALNGFLRFNMLFGIPLSLVLILFSKEFIYILYSEEFVSLSGVLYFFVVAQFFGFLAGGFQSIMVGRSFLRMHSVVSVSYSVITIGIPLFTINSFGLATIGLSMLIANAVTIMADYIYLQKKINVSLSNSVLNLFILAILCFVGAYYVQHLNIYVRMGFLLIGMILLMFNISKEEKEQLRKVYLKIKPKRQGA